MSILDWLFSRQELPERPPQTGPVASYPLHQPPALSVPARQPGDLWNSWLETTGKTRQEMSRYPQKTEAMRQLPSPRRRNTDKIAEESAHDDNWLIAKVPGSNQLPVEKDISLIATKKELDPSMLDEDTIAKLPALRALKQLAAKKEE